MVRLRFAQWASLIALFAVAVTFFGGILYAAITAEAEAQVRQIHMESPIQETTLSDGTRCAYIYERQQSIATITCDW